MFLGSAGLPVGKQDERSWLGWRRVEVGVEASGVPGKCMVEGRDGSLLAKEEGWLAVSRRDVA